jgi:hypothetical protein
MLRLMSTLQISVMIKIHQNGLKRQLVGTDRRWPLMADYCLSARCRKADKMLL